MKNSLFTIEWEWQMDMSMAGLNPKYFIGWIRFLFTMPASSAAQKSEAGLLCEFKTRNRYQQTLTV